MKHYAVFNFKSLLFVSTMFVRFGNMHRWALTSNVSSHNDCVGKVMFLKCFQVIRRWHNKSLSLPIALFSSTTTTIVQLVYVVPLFVHYQMCFIWHILLCGDEVVINKFKVFELKIKDVSSGFILL